MWQTYRDTDFGYTHRKRPYHSKPSFKRWTLKKLLPEVRNTVLIMRMRGGDPVCKERLAEQLRAKTHLVAQCLHILNLEGLVEKPKHFAPHDSGRDWSGWGSGGCGCTSMWMADRYNIRPVNKND